MFPNQRSCYGCQIRRSGVAGIRTQVPCTVCSVEIRQCHYRWPVLRFARYLFVPKGVGGKQFRVVTGSQRSRWLAFFCCPAQPAALVPLGRAIRPLRSSDQRGNAVQRGVADLRVAVSISWSLDLITVRRGSPCRPFLDFLCRSIACRPLVVEPAPRSYPGPVSPYISPPLAGVRGT